MKRGRRVLLACTVAIACAAVPLAVAQSNRANAGGNLQGLVQHRASNPNATAAYKWVDIMLEVTGNEVEKIGARPPIIARQMAIPMTAMYDAWAAYDGRAVGTRLGDQLRQPAAERTQKNKETAIAFAMYQTLVNLFPKDEAYITSEMRRMGYDPNDKPASQTAPQNIGRRAAAAVLEYRRHDGSNQYGDEPGTVSPGTPYSDYTGYAPKNTWDKVNDPDRWQPIPFSDGKGGQIVLGFLAPHWFKVKPFALESAAQFRPSPVPLYASKELKADVDENIAMNASLTIEQKSVVEFMRDGPRSTGQSGHWLQFAQDVSRRDHYNLDQDVKLFFAIGNTAMDAFIASWEAKRYYDSSRPWTLVRQYYAGKQIEGYLGPCKGVGPEPADKWHPYSPDTFVTPPFPGYPSGHSTVSGASSKMLELITGSDKFGAYYKHTAGMYTETGCSAGQMQAHGGKPDASATSAAVTLMLPTFTSVADMAGISRVLGGYHIQADNIKGLELGRAVATYSWPKYKAYFEGSARTTP